MKAVTCPYVLWLIAAGSFLCSVNAEAQDALRITTSMSPPEWALLEREVLDANSAAVREFYDHFFDERGYLLHVARWGAGAKRRGRERHNGGR